MGDNMGGGASSSASQFNPERSLRTILGERDYTVVRNFTPDQVRFDDVKLALDRRTSLVNIIGMWRSRRAIEAKGVPLGRFKTIFEPFSAYSSKAALFFPNYNLHIAVDQLPAWLKDPGDELVFDSNAILGRYDTINTLALILDRTNGLVAPILGSSKTISPQTRVKGITLFQSTDLVPASLTIPGLRADPIEGIGHHAYIAFDSGEGTAIRHRLQIQNSIAPYGPASNTRLWYQLLDMKSIDASIFSGTLEDYVKEFDLLREVIEAKLIKNKGVLLSGANEFYPIYHELTKYIEGFTELAPLGYGERTHVVWFKERS